MKSTLRQLSNLVLIAGLMFTLGCIRVEAQALTEPEMVQVQVGNGYVRQVAVGEPQAQCEAGTVLDLTQAEDDLNIIGYSFGQTGHVIAPRISEKNGTEVVTMLSIGHPSEYLVLSGSIAAVRMSENVPLPFYISGPTMYQSWKINPVQNRTTLVNGDTTVWITRTGDNLCVEIQTPVASTDGGVFQYFVDNGVLPQGDNIEEFLQ